MNQKRQTALYISLLSSLLLAAKGRKERDAREAFLQISKRLREDFCPPFDRSALLLLASDLYALALIRKRYVPDSEDERFVSLLSCSIGALSELQSPEYTPSSSEELIEICAKKSRTPQGPVYLACVRSLLFLVGNAL